MPNCLSKWLYILIRSESFKQTSMCLSGFVVLVIVCCCFSHFSKCNIFNMPFPHNKWVFNCKCSLMGCLFRYFAHVSEGLFACFFLLLSCKISLCILDTSSLSDNGFVKCFLQVVVSCYLHILCYRYAFASASFVEKGTVSP